METIATLSPDAEGVYPLPVDYLQYKRISENSVSPRRSLAYIEPTGVDQLVWPRTSGSGSNFTIIGSNLYGYPNSGATVELVYYAKIPPLTALAPENWLIDRQPQHLPVRQSDAWPPTR